MEDERQLMEEDRDPKQLYKTMKLKPINQQVVTIMGASSGIGRDAALKFAERERKSLFLLAARKGLDSLVEEIHRIGEAMPLAHGT